MKNFSSKYLIILGVLSLVILVSQILIQKTIKDNDSDSRIINISGRQRMLSQKITKAALKFRNASDLDTYIAAKNELRSSIDLLTVSHNALKFGDPEMDLNEIHNSDEVLGLFEKVEPLFEKITTAGNNLFDINFKTLEESPSLSNADQYLSTITHAEGKFLALMNAITFQYDKEASMKVEKLSRSEYYLLAFTFLLILLEGLLIFRPMVRSAKEKEYAISELDEQIQQSMKALGEKDKEKEYAASQIKEANSKIAELRKLAYDMKSQLSEKEKQHTLALSKHVAERTALVAQRQGSVSIINEQDKEIAFLKKQLNGSRSSALI